MSLWFGDPIGIFAMLVNFILLCQVVKSALPVAIKFCILIGKAIRLDQFHYNQFKYPCTPWHIQAIVNPLRAGKQQDCQSSLSATIWEVQSNIHEDSSGGLCVFWKCSTSCVYCFGSLMRNARLLGVRFVFPGGFLFRRESSAWLYYGCVTTGHKVMYMHLRVFRKDCFCDS